MKVQDYRFSWNSSPSPLLTKVKIEDDTLRDGLQGAFVRRPALEEKTELIELSAAVGTHAAMLGFPAISEQEFMECRQLLAAIREKSLPVAPRFLARADIRDVEPIIQLAREFGEDVCADFFIGVSPMRCVVEDWRVPEIAQRITRTGEHLAKHGTRFGVSLEDATRTPPETLRYFLETALGTGAGIITICDTTGESTPEGAARLVSFARECAERNGSEAEIWWHGHNDRGLGLANAIGAAEAGASTISGCFLGIGERTGNTSLEQLVVFLHQAGHRGFRIDRILPYCEKLSALTGVPIPVHAPLVGNQAFATCTGTHSAAILKARRLGPEFEDYVFSCVSARDLGREQVVMIGPNSGMANARYALEQLQLDASEENARRLLSFSRQKNTWLSNEDIRLVCARAAASGQSA